MPNGSLKYNQPELAKVAKVAEQVETLQKQWQEKATLWASETDPYPPEVTNDKKKLKALRECTSTYIPPHMRTELIKTLHESPEYGHAGVDEIVRRLAKVFTIPRLRAKLPRSLEPGSARFCDTILVI
ncbi:hypothetical protein COCSADRAFT_52399, partial [Bipolaris sorokiniana ND90Pr]